MSDVSESLQVRTNSPDHCIDRLRAIGFNGFVFPGQHGWLTVIPYGGRASLALSDQQLANFSATLAAPVLNYTVNDFGWGFQLALPDGRTTEFRRFFVDPADFGLPPNALQAKPLDEAVLSVVVPPARVRRLLQATPLPPKDGFEWELFAGALGFPQSKQLNPSYVTDNPDEMRHRGGIEVGVRPQSMRSHGSP